MYSKITDAFGPISPVPLDLLHDLIQRPTLHDESIDPHPGGRAVHAAVAMDEDRPGGRVLGQGQGLVQEGIRGVRRGIGGARHVVDSVLAGEFELVRQQRAALRRLLGEEVDDRAEVMAAPGRSPGRGAWASR